MNARERTPARQHLFEFLTHDELRLVLCVVMAATSDESLDCYPLTRHATPGAPSRTLDWSELSLRAIRHLALDHGYRFTALTPHAGGSVTAASPIEPRNYLYVTLLKAGGFPDFDVLLPRALEWAREHVPSLPLEPLRSLLADITAELSRRERLADPMVMAKVAKLRRDAIEAARDYLRTHADLPTERVH